MESSVAVFVLAACCLHAASAQFDLFGLAGGMGGMGGMGRGGGGGMGGFMDPFSMLGGGGNFGMGMGMGTGSAAPAAPVDPAAMREAQMTGAEEHMGELLTEAGANDPARQRVESFIRRSGGQLTGDAAALNYLVQDYYMTTPPPTPPPAPRPNPRPIQRPGAGPGQENPWPGQGPQSGPWGASPWPGQGPRPAPRQGMQPGPGGQGPRPSNNNNMGFQSLPYNMPPSGPNRQGATGPATQTRPGRRPGGRMSGRGGGRNRGRPAPPSTTALPEWQQWLFNSQTQAPKPPANAATRGSGFGPNQGPPPPNRRRSQRRGPPSGGRRTQNGLITANRPGPDPWNNNRAGPGPQNFNNPPPAQQKFNNAGPGPKPASGPNSGPPPQTQSQQPQAPAQKRTSIAVQRLKNIQTRIDNLMKSQAGAPASGTNQQLAALQQIRDILSGKHIKLPAANGPPPPQTPAANGPPPSNRPTPNGPPPPNRRSGRPPPSASNPAYQTMDQGPPTGKPAKRPPPMAHDIITRAPKPSGPQQGHGQNMGHGNNNAHGPSANFSPFGPGHGSAGMGHGGHGPPQGHGSYPGHGQGPSQHGLFGGPETGHGHGPRHGPAPGPPPVPAGTTVAPKLGDVRYMGNVRYVYTDADGFDTFQWVKATGPPPTQAPPAAENQQGQGQQGQGEQGQGQQGQNQPPA